MPMIDDDTPDDPGAPPFGDEVDDADARPRLHLVRAAGDGWRDALVLGKGDRPVPSLANVVCILLNHDGWRGCLAYDTFSERLVTTRVPPWHESYAPPGVAAGDITDGDLARFVLWLSLAEGMNVNDRVVAQAVGLVAEKNPIHPVRDYLAGLKWDGVKRLDDAAAYFGVELTDYTRAVVPRWFMSAVARIMVPGAQCDCVLILEGPTGWRKTSAFRALVPVREWYADSGIVIGSKDSYQNLHGVWIYGFDELDSLGRGELTATKNFVTQTFDRFRPPFGKVARNFQRQNVFCGSTNKDDYLNDPTGDRRYWPMTVARPADTDGITRDRDQLWAEAVARYRAGEVWHVDTPELRRLCEVEQALRNADDAWTPVVEAWLRNPLTKDPADGLPMSVDITNGVTTSDVLLGAIGMRAQDMTKGAEMRSAAVLRVLGFTHTTRPSDGTRTRRYHRAAP